MELQEAKEKFIHTWGTLATQWGINRTMSQIHALLLLSPSALNADQIMAELQISRGNVNMNLRELMSWNLIFKQLIPGERKEYFVAEKDIWKVARQIAKERRRREIEPIINTMEEIKSELAPDTQEKKEMLKIIEDIGKVTQFANDTIESVLKAEESWLLSNFLKIFKEH
ncbi:transcriptional regulator [Marinilongibacter aquaticus]|uniref:GbsR/MarR family transcriptional regulator n=1 Tax=Marinilongibacter aquaticus TaxID=2975157 RepID=UPI0021BD4499|nr:transcriptional regulator [Marinilongibacter aquaticus]UBM57966.1 transcriptional regulator [Marinilongibacter aquaticus]